MATATARTSKAQQFQQLLSDLAAAPDLAQYRSADVYSRLMQLKKHQPASSVELLLLLASVLQKGLQLLHSALEQQLVVDRQFLLTTTEVITLLGSCATTEEQQQMSGTLITGEFTRDRAMHVRGGISSTVKLHHLVLVAMPPTAPQSTAKQLC
jgi:hypothetical protein